MPIYEYLCKECSKKFEKLVLQGENETAECPQCRSKKTEKLFSSFSSGNSKNGAKNFSCPSGGCCPGCSQS